MPSTSSTPRKAAIQTITSRSALKPAHPNASENGTAPAQPTSDYFGINTFGWRQMRSKLPKDVYATLLASVRHGKKLDGDIAPTRRAGDQGVGDLPRGDALHPLVPAA